jgi:cobalamin biosynthesis Mg chelatase CobN
VSEKNGSSGGKPDVEALRAEIKQTRADLGETVQALAAKADVKARAKEQVEQTKQKVKAQAAEATERVREAAAAASGRVRHAGANARVAAAEAGDQAQDVTEQARRNPIPVAVVLAGVVAVIGVILIVRGRRR